MGWAAAIAEVLTPGVGVAISPIPIIAVLLMLTGPAGRRNGTTFVAGYTLALAAVTLAVLALASGVNVSQERVPSVAAGVVQLVLGVLFCYLAWSSWANRPDVGAEPSMPGWLRSLDSATPAAAFRLGLIISGANLKNLPLAVTAATGIARTGASTTAAVVATTVFVVLGSAGTALPLIAVVVGSAGITRTLDSAKTYLVQNNAIIMAVVFAVLGAHNISTGLVPLFS